MSGPHPPKHLRPCPLIHAQYMLGNQLISLHFEVSLSGEGTLKTPIRFVSPFFGFHHSRITTTLTYHTGRCLPKSSILCGFSKVLALPQHHHFRMNFINELLFSFNWKRYGGKRGLFFSFSFSKERSFFFFFQKGEEEKIFFTHALSPPPPPQKTKITLLEIAMYL